jgi:hypothetical protein
MVLKIGIGSPASGRGMSFLAGILGSNQQCLRSVKAYCAQEAGFFKSRSMSPAPAGNGSVRINLIRLPAIPRMMNSLRTKARVLGGFCLSLIAGGQGESQTKPGRQTLRAGDAR